jgi:uncharacterized membrane protein YidH (DUF202 family)
VFSVFGITANFRGIGGTKIGRRHKTKNPPRGAITAASAPHQQAMTMFQPQQPNTISVAILSFFLSLLFPCSVGGSISSSPLVFQYQEPPIHWTQVGPSVKTSVPNGINEKKASELHTLLCPTTGTLPAPDYVATRSSLTSSCELGSTVVVSGGETTTGLFVRHKQQKSQQQRQQPSQQRSRNSATNKVNHCVMVLFVFILVVGVFIVFMPPGKKRKKKKKICSRSEKKSLHNFNFVIAVLFLCAPPIHSRREASNALAMEQMAQAQAAQFELVAAAVAPSPPSSAAFGHYGIDKILCLGPIEDMVQRASAHVKKKRYENIGEGAVL